mgnify:FL=1
MTRRRAAIGLIVSVALVAAVAAFGGSFTASGIGSWYESLQKPAWTPPNWLFGPAWTTLYLMMAVAAWLVWKPAGLAAARGPLAAYVVQILLNGVWSAIFFGLKMPGTAFAEIVVLWLAILVTLVLFWRRSKLAGALLMPYILWVTYAGALNFSVWQLNA